MNDVFLVLFWVGVVVELVMDAVVTLLNRSTRYPLIYGWRLSLDQVLLEDVLWSPKAQRLMVPQDPF